MVFPFGVVLELIAVEVHFAQVAGGVALGLVVEMLRLGVAAFAASGDCQGMNLGAEFHYRNEAIPAGTVPFFRARVCARPEGGEGPPLRRRKADGDAGSGVVERLHDIPGEALEAVNLAPRGLPGPEISGEPGGCRREGLQETRRRDNAARGLPLPADLPAPKDRKRRGYRVYRPTQVPVA